MGYCWLSLGWHSDQQRLITIHLTDLCYFLNIAADFHQHWTRCGGGGDHCWCLRVQLLAGQRGHDCSNSDSYVTRTLCVRRKKNRRKQTMVMCFFAVCICFVLLVLSDVGSASNTKSTTVLCSSTWTASDWLNDCSCTCIQLHHDDVGGKRDILQFQHDGLSVNGPRGKWQKPVTHILVTDITNDLYNNHDCTHRENKKGLCCLKTC